MLGIMTPLNPRWSEFEIRLTGPEGCNFLRHPRSRDPKRLVWECDSDDRSCPKARAILKAMGATEEEIIKSILLFVALGGCCDCEIVFNVKDTFNELSAGQQRRLAK